MAVVDPAYRPTPCSVICTGVVMLGTVLESHKTMRCGQGPAARCHPGPIRSEDFTYTAKSWTNPHRKIQRSPHAPCRRLRLPRVDPSDVLHPWAVLEAHDPGALRELLPSLPHAKLLRLHNHLRRFRQRAVHPGLGPRRLPGPLPPAPKIICSRPTSSTTAPEPCPGPRTCAPSSAARTTRNSVAARERAFRLRRGCLPAARRTPCAGGRGQWPGPGFASSCLTAHCAVYKNFGWTRLRPPEGGVHRPVVQIHRTIMLP